MESCKDDIMGKFDYQVAMDKFDFLMMCFYEVLRMEPPAAQSTQQSVTRDVNIDVGGRKIHLKQGTQFSISFEGIHYDPHQWPEPTRFVPDRFNSKLKDNKWLLTSDGQPRNPLAFTPFMGGKRVCLGKTFAEVNIRFTLPLLLYFLDFEFADPAQARVPKQPYAAGGRDELDLKMRVTPRAK